MEISGIWELELMNIKIWFTHVSVSVRSLQVRGGGGGDTATFKKYD